MKTRPPIRVTRRAARQIHEAAGWWLANRPAVPDAVAEEIERAFELLSVQPGIGARAQNARLRGVRRIHITRIRYHIYYRVTSSAVEVIALWHSSRGSIPLV